MFARFQYALPELAGQLSAGDLQKVDSAFNKARRRQPAFNVPKSAALTEQSDKHLSQAALNLTHLFAVPTEKYV